ncbi:hypothetical protein SARC_01011 [Sphaeroforma arctica JP610]|uniref:Bms1-type G domain-containing protein n=1 Tax=Sphaeroforma arctica JP610 TaxID=667725 RepID=A0A0L0GCW9_9EUKA|nr:hypothetical protein SARC_01011 [Sphaeroforma arctica JP610]KNC86865.1 hypothetical protein SARC_01011 [Sphaeroforma arctica JP610]|eukprot:XP_014160767.1 hypothetical protein SARC_01011 [Sphaeroforma arctica JP610]
MEDSSQKGHQKSVTGGKAKARAAAEHRKVDRKHENSFNAKAFINASSVNAHKNLRRRNDLETKKHHIVMADRNVDEPPPYVVAVVGPPKVGKTTLIKSLVKRYTRQNINGEIKGPVTLISGKKRRLTFMECANDINSMVDIAKVADLVLLLIDASYGFEMETFEFLNICQVHGMPRIMGVLTHLDLFKNNKVLRKTKKRLKNRFWTEIYQGAKLFYLSGMIGQRYTQTEIMNLSRFISVMKFRPMTWRNTHGYVLADRMEDITNPEEKRVNPKCDRTVAVYGYVRGTHLKAHHKIHIPGMGDMYMENMSFLADPCPLPTQKKKRTLDEKERLLYAPMADIGDIVYDKDATYIDMGNFIRNRDAVDAADQSKIKVSEESNLIGSSEGDAAQDVTELPGVKMVDTLIDMPKGLDEMQTSAGLRFFSGGAVIKSGDFVQSQTDKAEGQDMGLGESEDEGVGGAQGKASTRKQPSERSEVVDGRRRRRAVFDDEADSDSDGGSGSDSEDDSNAEDEEGADMLNGGAKKGAKHGGKVSELDGETEEESVEFAESDSDMGEGQMNATDDDQSEDEDSYVAEIDRVASGSEEASSGSGSDSEEMDSDMQESEASDAGGDSDGDSDSADEGALQATGTKHAVTAQGKGKKGLGASVGESVESVGVDETHPSLRWKEDLALKAAESFKARRSKNIMTLVYGKGGNGNHDNEEAESSAKADQEEVAESGIFHLKKKDTGHSGINMFDATKHRLPAEFRHDWYSEGAQELIRNRFVTGTWAEDVDAETQLAKDDEEQRRQDALDRGMEVKDGDELFGDFEDLETGVRHGLGNEGESGDEDADDEDGDVVLDDGSAMETGDRVSELSKTAKMRRLEEIKKKKKAMFDKEYDTKDNTEFFDEMKKGIAEQSALNRAEFANESDEVRVQFEGYRPGMYVRVELVKIPYQFVQNFNPCYPLIMGALLSNEENLGFVHTRVKKHRWHKKILKNNDPLIISMGWRRFQTTVQYSIQDHNKRNRLLKYTPHHMHCNALFWGPLTPPNTGFLAIQKPSRDAPGFRIAATGVVLELDQSFEVVKKLKLTGTPTKIYKNTAFIKDMFSSDLEIQKFLGASIRTVSGIRGSVKKAMKGQGMPPGAYRATFEDKILMSDIVFLRCWYPVQPIKYYNPMTSLLSVEKGGTEDMPIMRTVGQMRRDAQIPVPVNKDSEYTKIERETRKFNPLKIPKALQADLPFASKPKLLVKKSANNKKNALKKKKANPFISHAVVMEPAEKRVYKLMQQINTIRNDKNLTKKGKNDERKAKKAKAEALHAQKRAAREKDEKKRHFRTVGKEEKRQEHSANKRRKTAD